MFSADLGIDLGTTRTRVHVSGRGVVLNEASVVAINAETGTAQAVGSAAEELLTRMPDIFTAITPLREGVISDLRPAEEMLHYFLHKAHRGRNFFRPRVAIGVRSGVTQVEKRAVVDSAYFTMPSEVHFVEQPIMAAVGADMPVAEPRGTMIVDIGGGTTDVAVISCMGIVHSHSVREAGNHMDEAIMDYLYRKYHLVIGKKLSEQIKIAIGSAYPLRKPVLMEITGRSVIYDDPTSITVDDDEIREALSGCVNSIVTAVKDVLECTPPELLADISERGIVLTGGGSLLNNLDVRIREETGLLVLMADHPFYNVVLGAGRALCNRKMLQKLSTQV